MSNDWFHLKLTKAGRPVVSALTDADLSPIPGTAGQRALAVLRGDAAPMDVGERCIADIRRGMLQRADHLPGSEADLEARVAALLARVDLHAQGDGALQQPVPAHTVDRQADEAWIQALAGRPVADAALGTQAADLRAGLLERMEAPPAEVDGLDHKADRLLQQFDQTQQQDRSLDVLAGRRPAQDGPDAALAALRQTVLARESGAQPPVEVSTWDIVRMQRVENTLLNVAPLLEPYVDAPAEPGLPTRRAEGYDFAFAKEKMSNAIYLLLSANWSEQEQQHPHAFDRSFGAVSPGLLREMVTDLVWLLAKDAMSYPGARPLDIRVVATIPEQRLEMSSRLHRLRLKMQRADLILSHLGPPEPGGPSQDAIFELGMATMLPTFEGNLFMLQDITDETRFNVNRDFKFRYAADQRHLSLARALAPFSLVRSAASHPEGMSEAFESLRKAGRWGLLLYVKLRNLALQRGMIATDLRGSGDPLINWMRTEEAFSAEARNSLSKVHAHAQ